MSKLDTAKRWAKDWLLELLAVGVVISVAVLTRYGNLLGGHH